MTKTINGLTAVTSAATGDFLAIWRAANNDTRKITKANFIGATLTGAGTIATGGFTLTVPATGTASLLGTAQTYSALKTFSAGITFGDDTLSKYDEGTWTPILADASSGGNTATLDSAIGLYTRIGKIVYVSCQIAGITTTGMTSGNGIFIRGLPFSSASTEQSYSAVFANVITFTGTLVVFLNSSNNYVGLRNIKSNDSLSLATIGDITSGSTSQIKFSMCYLTS